MVTHDDMSENVILEVKVHESELDTSLASLVATYAKDLEWIKNNHGIYSMQRCNKKGGLPREWYDFTFLLHKVFSFSIKKKCKYIL